MMIKKCFSLLSKLAIVAVFVMSISCAKHVAGPKGDPGKPGGTGNATQFTTSVFTVQSKDWTASGKNWLSKVYIPEITDNVVSSGELRVFMLADGMWWPLPYAKLDEFTQFSFEKGWLHLNVFKDHGTAPTPATTSYKAIIYYP